MRWIRTCWRTAVIAHPARYKMTRSKLRRLIGEFVEARGAASKWSPAATADDSFSMAVGARFRLLASAGSDYHGPEHPWIERLRPGAARRDEVI